MFPYFKEGTQEEQEIKTPLGLAVTHVDDILHAGEKAFDDKVIKPLKASLNFGTEEESQFRYIGMNVVQSPDKIKIDYKHYMEAVEIPNYVEMAEDEEGRLEAEGQTMFRSVLAKINTMGYQCRPDVIFEAKVLAQRYNKATKQDLKVACDKLNKMKTGANSIKYPHVGPIENWGIVGHGDAGIRSLPDKQTSVGGHVIMVSNTTNNKTCTIRWKAKRIDRVVKSSMAGEALATLETIAEVVYTKAILKNLFGTQIKNVPVIIAKPSTPHH